MSYCVNCGVELDKSAGECPLCGTVVYNPREAGRGGEGQPGVQSPFPREKREVETVNRKDFGILVSMVELATAATCGVLNAFVFQGTLWSLAVIGACLVLWVVMIPAVIDRRVPAWLSFLLDGAAAGGYLYMLTFQVGSGEWFWGLGLPIVVLVTGVAELLTLCIHRLPRSFLTVSLYLFSAVGLLCLGLEVLIDRYLYSKVHLSWSAVVMTVCIVLDIAIITLLSRRRLRNEVSRRLHF